MHKILLMITLLNYSIANATRTVGKVIKLTGSGSYLELRGKKPLQLKIGDELTYDTSVLVNDNSYTTIQLTNELSFVKIGQNSKISIRYEADQKTFYIQVFNGYVKGLFKTSQMADQMVIQTTQALITAKNSKFIVVSNPLIKGTTVFNYKGDLSIQDRHARFEKLEIPPQKFTYVNQRNSMASRPTFISTKRQSELSAIFDIDIKTKKSEFNF